MSLHYYRSGYRYRSASSTGSGNPGSQLQASDSDVAELSELDDDDEDDEDDEERGEHRRHRRARGGERRSSYSRRSKRHDHQDYGRERNDDENDEDDDDEPDNDDEEDDDDDDEEDEEEEEEEGDELPYPGFVPIALRYLDQTTRPRNWCLALITNPWFERVSMMVILLNCITLGMYQPCVDDKCVTNRCQILQMFDDIIFTFFSLEMTIKMVAMGIYGRGTYLADSWNRLDFFIVIAGALEYCLNVENMNLSAIRTIRVLRPLRAINRIPSMRILVMLLLDTLPMLGNVLLLCFFVFFIFGIVGVQLWEGILRQRCFLKALPNVKYPELLSDEYSIRSRIYDLEKYFEYQGQDYICSRPDDSGMHTCNNLPPLKFGNIVCNSTALPNSNATFINNETCVNWNYYYTECKGQGNNPFQGTISFDNIGLAWVAIFLVISLEGWTDIMYYVQDAHSFWDWIYFVLLIVIGSFFMINLCLVVIATQFSETKKREMERMRLERARFHSTSTLASSTNTSEPTTCYAEIVKYIGHLWRRGKRRLAKKYRLYLYRREQAREKNLSRNCNVRSNVVGLRGTCARAAHRDTCLGLLAGLESGEQVGSAIFVDPNVPVVSPELSESDQCNQINVRSTCDLHRATSVHSNGLIANDNSSARTCSHPNGEGQNNLALLSPPCGHNRRRSSVMFSDVVLLHGAASGANNAMPSSPGLGGAPSTPTTNNNNLLMASPPASTNIAPLGEKNICSSEKTTQTSDGNVWSTCRANNPQADLGKSEAMTCQELLALSGALGAALPTGQLARDTFLNSLAKGITDRGSTGGSQQQGEQQQERSMTDWTNETTGQSVQINCPCCCQVPMVGGASVGSQWPGEAPENPDGKWQSSRTRKFLKASGNCCVCGIRCVQRWVKKLVEHKYFQQGILLAILINTLSMGIEYHNQPEELTVIVEISNVVFSAVFAVEMLLKIIAEGPFGYISNGFNVFDGVVVVLSVVELFQSYATEDRGGSSGLSVLRTFRLLRILKLVRFMPNLRRQLFVMLRTMDNVAVFFSLLVLFIFIFSILGMNLFGCKFRETMKGSSDVECDRKNFDSLLWAIVTVFQILTQEDWNVVLFNGMQKTSHWAALYFVALMTFGNYVLFNLLVAILVEGFSSERNERREREQREMAKLSAKEGGIGSDDGSSRISRSHSITDSDTYTQQDRGGKNSWQSEQDFIKYKDNCGRDRNKDNRSWINHPIDEPKCNIQKESKMMGSGAGAQPPRITHTAATPQDSPNTTLDTGYRELNCRTVYPTNLSIESIDRSGSQWSIPSRLLKPPDNNHKFPTNNLVVANQIQLPVVRHVSPALTSNSSSSREFGSVSSPSRIQRGYSWRLSRPSLGRKRMSQSDEVEPGGQNIILNNGRSTGSRSHSILYPSDFIGYNTGGGYLHGSIRNDTQRDAPNNLSSFVGSNNRSTSPNNSIKSRSSSIARCYTPNQQMRWISDHISLSRRNSLRAGYDIVQSRGKMLPFDEQINLPPSLCSSTPRTINNLTIETVGAALPRIKRLVEEPHDPGEQTFGSRCHVAGEQSPPASNANPSVASSVETIKKIFMFFEPKGCLKERDDYSLYLFPPNNRFRILCRLFVEQKWFDNVVLLFIGLNCITLAMERPNIPPDSRERVFLSTANYIFTAVFAVEMFVKVVSSGMLYGSEAYFTSGWNIMDGSLVIISIIDLSMSVLSSSSPRIFGILRVFRLLRSLRPLRVINRAPGLKLVVQTLLSSLRPIGNIVLICCTFFIIFGILGVQLFKGAFYYCDGPDIKHVRNKTDCLADKRNVWLNRKYNFDDLGKALMSLFVLSSRDGWVNIMYTGLDAVGVDQQPEENYSEWRLLYFIAFILLVGFFVLNMFVGVVVENFHRCREEQEKEERVRRAAKRALQMEKKRRKMHQPPYYTNYSKTRLLVHNVVTSKYFDLAIAAVIGLNVVTMAMEFYMMPKALTYALKIFNYFFTAVFILESFMKLLALGIHLYLKDKWNQLDIGIVILSVVGIVLEELESKIIPINPTIIRVMRVLRIARVLKLLKMAKGIRALLDTVMQALPQVGNLGLLFFLLFFIFAALGVELFGRLECNDEMPCQGLGEHAHFSNFGMAFLTLFRVATGDNWNGIMKDTLRDDCDDAADCVKNCCVSTFIAPIFFVIFVLMAQFVLVNVVVAVLMKHLEESHKQMEDELDMETQLERELAAEQEELLEVGEEEEDEEEEDEDEEENNEDEEEDDDEEEGEAMSTGKANEENMENRTSEGPESGSTKIGGTIGVQENASSRDSGEVSRCNEIVNDEENDCRPIAIVGVTSGDSNRETSPQDSSIKSSKLEVKEVRKNIAEREDQSDSGKPALAKVRSLPSNFTYNPPARGGETRRKIEETSASGSWNAEEPSRRRAGGSFHRNSGSRSSSKRHKLKRRETFHAQQRAAAASLLSAAGSASRPPIEVAELIKQPTSNLSVPRIITQRNTSFSAPSGKKYGGQSSPAGATSPPEAGHPTVKSLLTVSSTTCPSPRASRLVSINADGTTRVERRHSSSLYPGGNNAAAAGSPSNNASNSNNSSNLNTAAAASTATGRFGSTRFPRGQSSSWKTPAEPRPTETELDVQSVINERRPSRLKSTINQTDTSLIRTENADENCQQDPNEQRSTAISIFEGPSDSPDFSKLYKNEEDTEEVPKAPEPETWTPLCSDAAPDPRLDPDESSSNNAKEEFIHGDQSIAHTNVVISVEYLDETVEPNTRTDNISHNEEPDDPLESLLPPAKRSDS
ncbi:voltage-dependent T-type calcium channel subunit alpha-1G isoform X2 [Venturia canescens]|uniref:voltage-dependent T-type calcium channel subunit alpha-1G isoform X2 n=1 Tax=Venturia canescens TaxID=32260 RepID=UPI001C9BFA3C|nr:voltage-dependent T-type calcium channel subunit alpha-1G isoform X2 [Venturia canescens]